MKSRAAACRANELVLSPSPQGFASAEQIAAEPEHMLPTRVACALSEPADGSAQVSNSKIAPLCSAPRVCRAGSRAAALLARTLRTAATARTLSNINNRFAARARARRAERRRRALRCTPSAPSACGNGTRACAARCTFSFFHSSKAFSEASLFSRGFGEASLTCNGRCKVKRGVTE